MNLQSYIQSGIVEGYVFGLLTPEEKIEFEYHLSVNPLLKQAVADVELQVEQFALGQAVPPPPHIRDQFTGFLQKLPVPDKKIKEPPPGGGNGDSPYIPAYEVTSNQIKVHKYWRIAFLILFIITKLLLIGLVYFIIKFYNAREEVQQMQQQQQEYNKAKP